MKTIKIPIYLLTEKDEKQVEIIQQQFSSATRISYNRILEEKLTMSEIEKEIKKLNNMNHLDSWFIRCARIKAESILKSILEINKDREKENNKNREKENNKNKDKENCKKLELINPKKIKFGTSHYFYQRLKGKITKEEWKEKRLLPINVQGELNQKGNRKFELDIDNNRIIFKPKCGIKINIILPKLRKNFYKQLKFIQETKELFSIELTTRFIFITFDEAKINKKEYKKVENRVLGIDINPNYIGYSIRDYSNKESKILDAKCYDLTKLNENLKLKSNNRKQLKQNNKRDYEIIQIVKDIIKQAIHFQVDKIVIEDLSMKSEDKKKGKKFNRLVNNVWNRNLFTKKLKMYCNIFGIKLVDVNPCYTSFIGNLQYNYFDPVNSSIEIGRRGNFKFDKGKFYPKLEVKDQWKKYLTEKADNWKDLHKKFESECIRYRVSLEDSSLSEFYRFRNIRSRIILYNFI